LNRVRESIYPFEHPLPNHKTRAAVKAERGKQNADRLPAWSVSVRSSATGGSANCSPSEPGFPSVRETMLRSRRVIRSYQPATYQKLSAGPEQLASSAKSFAPGEHRPLGKLHLPLLCCTTPNFQGLPRELHPVGCLPGNPTVERTVIRSCQCRVAVEISMNTLSRMG
jgi:hypothetical protein